MSEVLTYDQILKKNPRERLKKEKMPLDVINELPELIRQGYEDITEEDVVRLQWYGLYHDKPKIGTFMMRIKIPNGILTPQKLWIIGELSQKFGKGYGELTTRQDIQLHWIRLETLPEIFKALQDAGLSTVGACGDVVRNITGCPVAGLDKQELFDASPLVMEITRFLEGNREYSDLPRKHKITISACKYRCNAPEIHCQAFVGVKKKEGDQERLGFTVWVGGGLSTVPRIAKPLGVFIPIADTLPVIRAVLDVWKEDLKYRRSFIKARLKFMIDDYGPEAFKSLIENKLGKTLEDFTEQGVFDVPAQPMDRTSHLGVHEQKQEGFYYIGFPVLIGRLAGEQMIQIADLVEQEGYDIRLTREQNLILTHIPGFRLDHVLKRMEAVGLTLKASKLQGPGIACTGQPHCNFAVTETKGRLVEVISHLENAFGEDVGDLRIYLDGCPHACGAHWVGDIGLQGTTARSSSGEKMEAYDIFLGGGLGNKPLIGKAVGRRVPADQVKHYLERLIRSYQAYIRDTRPQQDSLDTGHDATDGLKKENVISFQEFCLKHSDEQLKTLMEG
jgi:ferredoxin-nitrite reductase